MSALPAAVRSAAIFSLAKESPREIEVMVDESDAGLVKAGQPVDLTSEAFPGKSWREQITEVSPAVKKEGGANSIKVRVSHGTDAPALKLGQQVDAKIQTGHRVDIAKLPFECIINVGGKTSVAIPKGGAIRFAPVDTGIEDAISVEIVRGVSMGEEVILPEGKQLKEGERIRIVTKEPSRQ